MNKVICIVGLCSLFFSISVSNASTELDKLNQSISNINAQVERLSYEINLNTKEIANDRRVQTGRIEANSQEIKTLAELRGNLKSGVEKFKQIEARLNEINSSFNKIIENQAGFSAQLQGYDEKYKEIKNEITLSKSVVTWVTAIVSIVVILVGLFFSQRFLELYSNYKVIRAQYSKEKRDELGL